MTFLLTLAFAAGLSAADLEKLGAFTSAWSNPTPEAATEARALFQGRGAEIAEHFLVHNDPRPRFDAFAFVLRALGEVDATLALLRALPDPPHAESGFLDRHWTEIDTLIDASLENETVAAEPHVVEAIVEAIAAARAKPYDAPVAKMAVSLLGKCRGPEAVQALSALAADRDSSIRAAAAEALGWLRQHGVSGTGVAAPAVADRALEALARTLAVDPDLDARREAAESLGRLEIEGGAEPLQRALPKEEAPQVVDAIVSALERLRAPITDPALCREIAGRCWEAGVARPLFERWRAAATRGALLDAAIEGPPTFRALALQALVGAPQPRRPLVREPVPPPPEPRGPLAARAAGHADDTVLHEDPSYGVAADLDVPTVERLIASAVDVLGAERSISTNGTAMEAFWALVGRDTGVALRRADGIENPIYRYWASSALQRKDPGGYEHYRRARELAAAAAMAVPFVLLLWVPSRRPVAGITLAAIAGWGASALAAEGALGLPPWPYPLSEVRFLAALAAGIASAVAIFLPRLRIVAAMFFAGTLFLVEYWLTRGIGFYPPDTQSGYAFFFEPAIGIVTAPAFALLITAVAGLWTS